jgi:translation elongation factor EF-1alpha
MDGWEGKVAGKSRVPMQVSPKFENRIKKLQEEIMKKKGKSISLRDLTEVAKIPSIDEFEKEILNQDFMNIKIHFDRRRR